MKSLYRYGLALIMATLLISCGFQPRGVTELPPQLQELNILTVDIDDSTLLLLKERLTQNGITIHDSEETFNPASPTLLLSKERLSQRTLSLQRNESRTNSGEFELVNEVHIEMKSSDESFLIEPDTLYDRKVYYNDVTRVIGKETEAELYRQELKQGIVRKIILRLESLDGLK